MNDESLNRYFAAARARRRDTSRVEFGLETRLMARLRAKRERDPWFAWAWRLCPLFAVIALVVAGWSHYSSPDITNSVTQNADDLLSMEYLTGNQL